MLFFFCSYSFVFCYWGLFSWVLCPFNTPRHFLFCFVSTSLLSGARLILCIPCCVFLESAIYLRSSCSFYWQMLLKTKIWVIGVLIATKVSLLLCLLNPQNNAIYVYICANWYLYMYLYIFIYLYINIKINKFTLMSPTLIHLAHSSFLLLHVC